MSYEHLKASWRAEVEAIVRAELGKMESEIARMHHQVEQSFTQLLSQSAARLAAVSHDAAIADFAERAMAHLAALSPVTTTTETVAPPSAERTDAPLPADDTPPPPSADRPVDLQALYYYILELQSQQTQADVLNLLIARAVEYAPRVALFVVKSGNVVAWTERGFETSGVALRGLTLPLQAQTTLLAAVEQQTAVLDSPYAFSENQLLLDRIGSVPEAIAGIPLMVRGKAAAVLYADTSDQAVASIALAPLQILVNVAGLTVELLNARNRLATTTVATPDRTTQNISTPVRETPPAPPTSTAEETAPATTETKVDSAPSSETPTTVSAHEPKLYPVEPKADEPQVEAVAPPQVEPPAETPVAETPVEATPPVAFVPAETSAGMPPVETVPAAPPSVYEHAGDVSSFAPSTTAPSVFEAPPREPSFEPEKLPPVVPAGPIVQGPASFDSKVHISPSAGPAVEPPAPVPVYEAPAEPPPSPAVPIFDPMAPETSTPSPTNGLFTVEPLPSQLPPPVAPVDVKTSLPLSPPKPSTEEEIKAHNDARRFARLLVSEIKLYNEAKVIEGRTNRDLYDRLKEDIDRSRQMYDKRVNPIVAAKYDYFYDELVSSLAEGDASRLGVDCPGPVLVQPE